MTIHFYKYQGTGNDFIMVDNRKKVIDLNNISQESIENICDRHMGIGADGFILLNEKEGYDFEMGYYNSDGNLSTMCGNGGRCLVAFAKHLDIITDSAHFLAIDGEHHATIHNNIVSLEMKDVENIKSFETFYQLDTGSPHYVSFVDDVEDINVAQDGELIRNSPMFKEEGINVNFVQENNDSSLYVRTYERGVEDETLSCGTGVTACALVQMQRKNIDSVHIETLGGDLTVSATMEGKTFTNVLLQGTATFVFEGHIDL